MNASEAIAYIHSTVWLGSRPGLERITALMHGLGDVQDTLRFIHVAGTNGKGSTCAMLASALQAGGYRVGLFTSPYVRTFHERIRYNGENISDQDLADCTEAVKQVADTLPDPPTEFELITAIGLVYFARKKCDVVVLEVGMGGRLDSTNLIRTPVLSVITGIALDHTAFLGDTVEAIAAEKAGIIKPGVPVLYGGQDEAAFRVIAERARALGAPIARTELAALHSISLSLEGTTFDYREQRGVHLSLVGRHQPENAATVLDALALIQNDFPLSQNAIRQGLADTRWPARLELLDPHPVLFDGGHNPQGVQAVVASLKELLGAQRLLLCCGVMQDKDVGSIVRLLSPLCREVVTVAPNNPRAMAPEALARLFEGYGVPSNAFSDREEGITSAIRRAREASLPLLFCGSLYLYADVAPHFGR